MTQPLIVAETLGKDFREGFRMRRTTALQSLSFALGPATILGLLGPNGAGKSTTLSLLLGFLSPSRGSVRLVGYPPTNPLARRSVGFLPEAFDFDRFSTGHSLLRRFDAFSGGLPLGRERRVALSLGMVGLEEAGLRRLSTYSKGMMQRIGVAQALLGDPDLLILDEPMSGMDPASRSTVAEILRDRRNRGKTTLLSSHIISDVEALADRVLILDHGALVADHTLSATSHGHYSIVFRTESPEQCDSVLIALGLRPATLQQCSQHYQVLVEEPTKNQLISELVGAGADIVSVAAERQSLESLFLSLTGDRGSAPTRPSSQSGG